MIALATGHRARALVALGLATALAALAAMLAVWGFHHVPRPRPLEELSYYPSGRHLRPATLGHAETTADLAWIRAVQYYGEHRRSDNRFTRMAHVFDILTTLAPRFTPAYVFGAFALAQEGQNFPAAERLMLKGIEANPTDASLAFKLGFLYYVRPGGRDFQRAAEYFQQAARQPEAPPEAARFAAFARQNSGNLLVAYELWAEVARSSPNFYLQEGARREMDRIRMALRAGRTEMAIKKLGTPTVILSDP